LTSRADRSATVAEFMQGDGIHPNAAGVALIVQDIGPAVLKLIGKDAK
jgi:acyl-CoA thioesterase-1